MKCEIIAVGTELLLGNIVNTNAQYLSQKLADLGIDVYYHQVVGDNKKRIQEAIINGMKRADILITTGGLGPTDDDLTKEAVSEALGLTLALHQESLDKIVNFFNSIGREMVECNKKQAYIPEGSQILINNNGTAPGVLIEKENKIIVLLPGPPKELMPMFEESVFPYLRKKSKSMIKSKILRVTGVGESTIQEMLNDLFINQTNPTLAPYAKDGEVHLRISAKTEDEKEADCLIAKMEANVRNILKENVYGVDDETLEEVVAKLLMDKNMTIALAESCTGGLIASRLTDIPGVSAVFMNSIVSYSNQSKQQFLGVSEDTIRVYGAVSRETAYEMAEGVQKNSNTNIGLSVTGIAGPDGGSIEKPVGLFYIGLAINGKVETYKHMFAGNRKKIKWTASVRALDAVRRALISI